MIVNNHGCSSKGIMGCWLRNYSFTWMMSSLSGPPIYYVGNPLKGVCQSSPGLVFSTPP